MTEPFIQQIQIQGMSAMADVGTFIEALWTCLWHNSRDWRGTILLV